MAPTKPESHCAHQGREGAAAGREVSRRGCRQRACRCRRRRAASSGRRAGTSGRGSWAWAWAGAQCSQRPESQKGEPAALPTGQDQSRCRPGSSAGLPQRGLRAGPRREPGPLPGHVLFPCKAPLRTRGGWQRQGKDGSQAGSRGHRCQDQRVPGTDAQGRVRSRGQLHHPILQPCRPRLEEVEPPALAHSQAAGLGS